MTKLTDKEKDEVNRLCEAFDEMLAKYKLKPGLYFIEDESGENIGMKYNHKKPVDWMKK